MHPEPTPAAPAGPAGTGPASAGPVPARAIRLSRRYRPRHDAAVVLAEIRRLQGAARTLTARDRSRPADRRRAVRGAVTGGAR